MKRAFVLLPLALLAGCSSFDAKYDKILESKTNGSAPVEGAWIGRWQSTSGHGGGELRAVITPDGKSGAMAADKSYSADFKAKWGFFTSEYSTPLTSHSDLKNITDVKVHAETDLGLMIGKYSMDGASTASKLSAKYKSAGDEGTIELTRP